MASNKKYHFYNIAFLLHLILICLHICQLVVSVEEGSQIALRDIGKCEYLNVYGWDDEESCQNRCKCDYAVCKKNEAKYACVTELPGECQFNQGFDNKTECERNCICEDGYCASASGKIVCLNRKECLIGGGDQKYGQLEKCQAVCKCGEAEIKCLNTIPGLYYPLCIVACDVGKRKDRLDNCKYNCQCKDKLYECMNPSRHSKKFQCLANTCQQNRVSEDTEEGCERRCSTCEKNVKCVKKKDKFECLDACANSTSFATMEDCNIQCQCNDVPGEPNKCVQWSDGTFHCESSLSGGDSKFCQVGTGFAPVGLGSIDCGDKCKCNGSPRYKCIKNPAIDSFTCQTCNHTKIFLSRDVCNRECVCNDAAIRICLPTIQDITLYRCFKKKCEDKTQYRPDSEGMKECQRFCKCEFGVCTTERDKQKRATHIYCKTSDTCSWGFSAKELPHFIYRYYCRCNAGIILKHPTKQGHFACYKRTCDHVKLFASYDECRYSRDCHCKYGKCAAVISGDPNSTTTQYICEKVIPPKVCSYDVTHESADICEDECRCGEGSCRNSVCGRPIYCDYETTTDTLEACTKNCQCNLHGARCQDSGKDKPAWKCFDDAKCSGENANATLLAKNCRCYSKSVQKNGDVYKCLQNPDRCDRETHFPTKERCELFCNQCSKFIKQKYTCDEFEGRAGQYFKCAKNCRINQFSFEKSVCDASCGGSGPCSGEKYHCYLDTKIFTDPVFENVNPKPRLFRCQAESEIKEIRVQEDYEAGCDYKAVYPTVELCKKEACPCTVGRCQRYEAEGLEYYKCVKDETQLPPFCGYYYEPGKRNPVRYKTTNRVRCFARCKCSFATTCQATETRPIEYFCQNCNAQDGQFATDEGTCRTRCGCGKCAVSKWISPFTGKEKFRYVCVKN